MITTPVKIFERSDPLEMRKKHTGGGYLCNSAIAVKQFCFDVRKEGQQRRCRKDRAVLFWRVSERNGGLLQESGQGLLRCR